MRVRLHLDADASSKALVKALAARGHDITRTPNEWMPLAASDEEQLDGATRHGRCLFSFNVRDFSRLAGSSPEHRGVLLAQQRQWTLSSLIAALDRFLSEGSAEETAGQVLWLSRWRQEPD